MHKFLYARLQTGRIMVWWCLSVRPSGSPSVRLSVRPSDSPSGSPSASFPHFSPTCFDILSWNYAYDFILLYYRSSLSVVNLRQVLLTFGTKNTGNTQFSALFSYMLWHIELTCCTWLCFTVLQIKFECRQFASSFVGVMPLLELRILKINSFPHFSLTCFDILSWNFAHDFV